jgi:isoleucyl-tRNA synthetase
MDSYPVADESLIDSELEETMDVTEKIVSLGRAARSRKNLKVRQPLSRLMIKLPNWLPAERLQGFSDIVRDELNIKEVSPAENLDQLVTYSAKLNFKTAGPKLGGNVKQAAAFVTALDSDTVKNFAETKTLTFEIDSEKIELTDEEIDVVKTENDGYAVESEGHLTVALDIRLTDDLIDEGFAREIVNKVQNMRKSSGFEVTDRIDIKINSTDRLTGAVKRHDDFIRGETLADSISFLEEKSFDGCTEWNINGVGATIAVIRRDSKSE